MSCFQKKPSNKVGPYGERDFLHQKDLLDPEVGAVVGGLRPGVSWSFDEFHCGESTCPSSI